MHGTSTQEIEYSLVATQLQEVPFGQHRPIIHPPVQKARSGHDEIGAAGMNIQAIDKLNDAIMVLSGLRDTTLGLTESSSGATNNQMVLFHKVLEGCVNDLQEIKQEVSAVYSVNVKDVLTDMRAELLLQNIEFDEDELR